MTSKQELTNWMTEKREGLTFENKVQLIYDFWQVKDEINNLLEKYKKDNLKEITKLIEEKFKENRELSEEKNDWKTAWQQVQQDAKEQIEQLNEETKLLEAQITQKDDRNAQLHELFQGTAEIFSKQHNYVDQLKKQLEQESQNKNISQEQAQHLKEDVKRLDQEKQELGQRIKKIKEINQKGKAVRDLELANLRTKNQELNEKVAQQAQTIKDLTEVKMKREESEKRLRKQSDDFLQVQRMNKTVYDILGEFSQQNGLLLRSQEVVRKVKTLTAELDDTQLTAEEAAWLLAFNNYYLSNDHSQNKTNHNKMIAATPKSPLKGLKFFGIDRINKVNQEILNLNNFYQYYQEEAGWWDKWISDIDQTWSPHASSRANLNMSDVARNKIKDIAKIHAVNSVFFKQELATQTTSINFQGVKWGNILEDVSTNYSEINAQKTINLLKAIGQYYRDK